jgi:ABC-type glycerol-3-phosphate transport system substrate-binding protein
MARKIIAVVAVASLVVFASFVRAEASEAKLLFTYSPGCPHCGYQRPIIKEFEDRHPEVEVTWVRYYELNGEQEKLIEGTSGHPMMVFHSGGHTRQVVGRTSLSKLEEEYETFKGQLRKAGRSRTTTGSYIVCY